MNCYFAFFYNIIISFFILNYIPFWLIFSFYCTFGITWLHPKHLVTVPLCHFRSKSGFRTVEPKRGNWSRRRWVSRTAAGGLCTVTRVQWVLCRYQGPSVPQKSTGLCTLLKEWTPCHLSGIYSKWLWLSEVFIFLDHVTKRSTPTRWQDACSQRIWTLVLRHKAVD